MSDHKGITDRKQESIGIINALRRGTVPQSGLSRLAVGLSAEERVISSQLEYVAGGHADCKFVRGEYGSGKTFLISRAVEIGQKQRFSPFDSSRFGAGVCLILALGCIFIGRRFQKEVM